MTRLAVIAVTAMALAGCGSTSGIDHSTPVAVTVSANGCDVTPPTATSGTVVFSVQNTASSAVGFALTAADGTLVGQLENLGPGEARDLVLEATQGTYTTTCHTDHDIPARFVVTSE